MLPRAGRGPAAHRTRRVFVCPSVYEPLGIVNLEAMACETAVVACAVGGIPEVVDDGETGLLVPYDAGDPEGFEAALAEAVNALVADPDAGRGDGRGRAGAGRARVRLGRDRPPHRRGLRLAPLSRPASAACRGPLGRGPRPTGRVKRGARRSRAASRPSSTSAVR